MCKVEPAVRLRDPPGSPQCPRPASRSPATRAREAGEVFGGGGGGGGAPRGAARPLQKVRKTDKKKQRRGFTSTDQSGRASSKHNHRDKNQSFDNKKLGETSQDKK